MAAAAAACASSHEAEEFAAPLEQAQRESLAAFGSPDVFLEKFIPRPRHIEVQLLGDKHGNLVHLFERDCSVQRRHQKVVEIAPAPNLDPATARRDSATRRSRSAARSNYENAGTVEFLVDADTDKFYFIEVNPRIQVEHTVTEEVTGVDIVKCADPDRPGHAAGRSRRSAWPSQDDDPHARLRHAVPRDDRRSRRTTSCPTTAGSPHYRSAGGMGIRLDAGTAFSGAVVTPFYDSLLVKVTARGRRFIDAARRMERCLQEFRIRGVKTNIPFLINLVTHPTFLAGGCTTRFIDETPELFDFAAAPATGRRKLLHVPGRGDRQRQSAGQGAARARCAASRRRCRRSTTRSRCPPGTRQKLQELGPEKFAKWVLRAEAAAADRHDVPRRPSVAAGHAVAHVRHAGDRRRLCPALPASCSRSRCGAGRRSTRRCGSSRNVPGSGWPTCASGFPTSCSRCCCGPRTPSATRTIPTTSSRRSCKKRPQAGIDVFRIFDSLNWVPNMQVAMDAVLEDRRASAKPAICYTGDILDPKRTKYDLKYYVELAKELEKMGAHILAIKDMAGLCKPYAAELLVKTLKQEIGIPIHFHTHDTGGMQAASILKAAEAGVDIADGAMAPMSGGTSQPNLNTLVEALRFTPRDTGLDFDSARRDRRLLARRSASSTRRSKAGMLAGDGRPLPATRCPAGSTRTCTSRRRPLGLADRWPEVCRMYADVNQLFGDIVKVTPTSKAVGDMALFLVANNLTADDVSTATTASWRFPSRWST